MKPPPDIRRAVTGRASIHSVTDRHIVSHRELAVKPASRQASHRASFPDSLIAASLAISLA